MLFATGKAAAARRADDHASSTTARLSGFKRALNALLLELAHLVCKDGEGARKFVEVRVAGAASSRSAKRVALSIANSPLVKTAIAGEDANWGRVVMAVGKAGEPADRDRLDISFGEIMVAKQGARAPSYDEAAVSDLHEGRAYRHHRRSRPRSGQGHRLDLRSHQGLCRDQWRLPLLTRFAPPARNLRHRSDQAIQSARARLWMASLRAQ